MGSEAFPFDRRRAGTLAFCVILYTVLYTCRLNLSAALHALAADQGLSLAAAGILPTAYAVVYACGQMVNGAIVDRVNPYRYMIAGLAGSALCNLAMSYAQGFAAMAVIWTVNAVFQSMLWTPIVRIVADTFTGKRERDVANAALALTLIAGHLLAWAISGFMAERFGWRLSFRAPALLAAVTACAAGVYARGELCGGHRAAQNAKAGEAECARPSSGLLSAGFLLVLGACVLYGFIRDGVVTWTPSILSDIGREQALSSAAFSLILPLVNFLGVLAGLFMRRRGAAPRRIVAAMMLSALVCCAALLPAGGMLAVALLLGCVCAAMYGANPMLTALIPMEYSAIGRSGMAAGLVDACIYLGSALAGVLAGGVYESGGLGALCVIWMAACAAGAGMMLLSGRKRA